MSNDFAPLWSRPARNRVLAALARHPGAMSVREIARLAHVAPSTALRVTDELVKSGALERRKVRWKTKDGWMAEPRVLLELRKGEREKLRGDYPTFRSDAEVLEYLAALDAPVWVIDRSVLAQAGVTRRVPTFVVLPRSWTGRFKIPVPIAVFEEARPLELAGDDLPWPDLLIALLKIDTLAARQYYNSLAKRPGLIYAQSRRTLLRRIRTEGVTKAATAAGIPLDSRRGPRARAT